MNKIKILKILKKDPIRNMSIIGFVENYEIQKVLNINETIILLAESDHLWAYVSSTNKDELNTLLSNNKLPTKYYANLEDWMIPIITKNNEVKWKLKTRRYYFPEDLNIGQPKNKVGNLREEDIQVILDNSEYVEYLSYDMVYERINKGISAGIRVDNKLIAWGLTHDDKSMGFLHVLPEYRNRGYAQDIGKYLINEKRKLNELAYVNIVPDNIKSIKLSEGIGFKYDRNMSWLKLK